MYAMPGSSVIPYKGKLPKVGKTNFLASGAHLIGDLETGEDCSFWFNTVVRADCHYIRIGARVNVQDNATVHVTGSTGPTQIGNDVTIGHGAIIHACTIEEQCLIGMGSVILDGVRIRKNSFVAAGSVLTPGKEFPEGVLIKGFPAQVARPLNPDEIAGIKKSVQYYLEYKRNYELAR